MWRSLSSRTCSRHSRRMEARRALSKGVLPGAGGRGRDFADPHPPHRLSERVTVDAVAIAEEGGGCSVIRQGVHDLLGRPVGGGVLSDNELDERRRW